MIKTLVVSFCFTFFCINLSNAQNVTDTIRIKKGLFGKIYIKDGKSIGNGRGLNRLLTSNPETAAEVKMMRANAVFSAIFGGTGGFIFGYQLGSSYTRSTPNWGALIPAAILVGISIPLEIGKTRHLEKAILIYNKGLMQASKRKVECNFGVSNNGVGLKVSF